MRRDLWCLLVLCLGISPAHAETVYVIDKLQVGLRAARDGAVVKPVETGAALEVLERDGRFVRVRDRQGSEGWLETRYVSTEAPARLQLARLQEELSKARAQLAEAQTQVKAAPDVADAGKTDPAASVVRGASPPANETPDEFRLDYLWLLVAFAMLLIGFVAGIVWHRESIRRRMGGMYLRI